MKLYFRDTIMSYAECINLMTRCIGTSGPDTWQTDIAEDGKGYYIEIYNNHSSSVFVKLKW